MHGGDSVLVTLVDYENAECCQLLIALALLQLEGSVCSVDLFQLQMSVLCEGQPSFKRGRQDFRGLV